MTHRATALAVLAVLPLSGLGACSDDTPRSTPTSKESATTEVEPEYAVLGEQHLTSPGRWAVTAFGDPEAPLAVFDVPAGFQGVESWVWTDTEGPRRFGQVSYASPTRVPADPCDVEASSLPVGDTVDDLAAALAAQRRTRTTAPTPVEVDGHRGVYLELTTPTRRELPHCSGDEGIVIWEAGDDDDRGLDWASTERTWILDVDGRRVVVSALTVRHADRRTVALLTRLVGTARFVAP